MGFLQSGIKMTENDAIELLAQSIVMPSSFQPFSDFMGGSSISISHESAPVILLGPSHSTFARAVGDRLIEEEQFINLVHFLYGAGELTIETVEHEKCIRGESCHSIVQSQQGQLEYGESGDHNLIAILPHPDQAKSQAMAVGMCISNIIMKCLIPNSTDLSINATISKLPH